MKSKNNLAKYKIPDEYIIRHEFLVYCKNCLNDLINYVDEHRLSSEKIVYKSKQDEQTFLELFEKKSTKQEKNNWLLNNGYKDIVYGYYYKHLLFSLIVDFSNYYTASIKNAFHGNINVAWALMRRPLQETLAYIEWLRVDKDELLKLMIEEKDVTKYEIIKQKVKIKNHIDKIQSKEISKVIDIYKFRYSYDEEFTLNGILQASNHLITTRPVLKTEPSGLNFVFLDDEMVNRNIGFYYSSIPYVMLYTMNLIMEMFDEIAGFNDFTKLMNKLNLNLKNLEAGSASFSKVKEILLKDISFFCPKCVKEYKEDIDWIKFTDNKFQCKKCSTRLNTRGYIFEYENGIINNT